MTTRELPSSALTLRPTLASAATAVVALVRPFLKLDERERVYVALASGYERIFHEYKSLRRDIANTGAYTELHQAAAMHLRGEVGMLKEKHGTTETPRDSVVRELQCQVERRFPPDDFFVPEA